MKQIRTIKLAWLFIIIFSRNVHAQDMPYERLDSLTAAICSLQLKADYTIYNDGMDDYTLSFPEQNFGILLHSMEAYSAVYKQWDSGMALVLNEHIDLAKATGITYKEPVDGKTGIIRLYFPPRHLLTHFIEEGKPVTKVYQNFIEFYYKPGNKNLNDLYSAILALYFTMKMTNGDYTAKQVQELGQAYTNAMNAHTKEAYEIFLSNYGNSIWAMEARQKIKAFEEEERREQEKAMQKSLAR